MNFFCGPHVYLIIAKHLVPAETFDSVLDRAHTIYVLQCSACGNLKNHRVDGTEIEKCISSKLPLTPTL